MWLCSPHHIYTYFSRQTSATQTRITKQDAEYTNRLKKKKKTLAVLSSQKSEIWDLLLKSSLTEIKNFHIFSHIFSWRKVSAGWRWLAASSLSSWCSQLASSHSWLLVKSEIQFISPGRGFGPDQESLTDWCGTFDKCIFGYSGVLYCFRALWWLFWASHHIFICFYICFCLLSVSNRINKICLNPAWSRSIYSKSMKNGHCSWCCHLKRANTWQCSLKNSFIHQLTWHWHDCRAGIEEAPSASFIGRMNKRKCANVHCQGLNHQYHSLV